MSQLSDDNLLIREEARSSGSDLSESGDWQVIDETNIAVDYSNVHVFLKTLQAWQSAQDSSNDGIDSKTGFNDATLQVNLDEALCDQVFATMDADLTPDQVA